MRIFLIIIIVAFAASCKQQTEKKPDDIWSREKFVDAMVEVQITEAFIRLGYNRSHESYRHKDSLFKSTFDELGVSREEFERNFTYYSNRPKEMEEIYEEVIENLSTKQAELQGEVQQEQE